MSSLADLGASGRATGASGTRQVSAPSWRCARCGVTARWLPGHVPQGLPAGWVEQGGIAHCLACRRALAAEAGVARAPAEPTRQARATLRAWALLEFEIERDPDRPNGVIARAVGSSVPAVIKARRRLESRRSSAGATAAPTGATADPAGQASGEARPV
jgi:hypothetical protein